nr:PREDICTED: protein farnesyltransferase subunit beta-like [Struthio camelus australis]
MQKKPDAFLNRGSQEPPALCSPDRVTLLPNSAWRAGIQNSSAVAVWDSESIAKDIVVKRPALNCPGKSAPLLARGKGRSGCSRSLLVRGIGAHDWSRGGAQRVLCQGERWDCFPKLTLFCFSPHRYAPPPCGLLQTKVEDIVQEVFNAYKSNHHTSQFVLQREKHFHYLKRGLRQLTEAYECLDASRPWLCYWILHSLELLEEPIPESVASESEMESKRSHSGCCDVRAWGGWTLTGPSCPAGSCRKKLLEYLHSLKQPDGSFLMHVGGEVDVRWVGAAEDGLPTLGSTSLGNASLPRCSRRGVYPGCGPAELRPRWGPSRATARFKRPLCSPRAAVRSRLGPERSGGLDVARRPAEIGMGVSTGLWWWGMSCARLELPGAVIALATAPVCPLQHWVTSRQMRFEGGFQGRCNKLVDGCYSFWQDGPLSHRALHARGDAALSMTHWMFDQSALQEYILLCCQCPAGGLLDKPGNWSCARATHPVYNIAPEKVIQAVMHFLQQPVPSLELETPAAAAD